MTLPHDLIIHILSWLPVKSLLRFKCVSKSWLSLISSSQFIRIHLSASANDMNLSTHKLILQKPYKIVKQCPLSSLFLEPFSNTLDFDYYPSSHGGVPLDFSGSVGVYIAIVLWNPATREFKTLWLDSRSDRDRALTYGFGYDESNDDYKIVGIYCPGPWMKDSRNMVKVYTLRNDSWRTMETVPLPYASPYYGVGAIFVNGNLHWQMHDFYQRDHPECSRDIAAFDLETEECKGMKPPKVECDNWKLCQLKGYLSALCNYGDTRSDLWVMKQYGSEDSWTKVASLPYLSHIKDLYDSYPSTIWVGRSGDILLKTNLNMLFLYNAKDNSLRRLENDFSDGCPTLVYVESLVSLNPSL
ncbi:hypothetical protein Leryth_019077 [Lithospermum erythrorhizon]|nr:hypothetical protein Leryth_019077 [Lithospermum erythrorhizon]